jgi:hypothetical protein
MGTRYATTLKTVSYSFDGILVEFLVGTFYLHLGGELLLNDAGAFEKAEKYNLTNQWGGWGDVDGQFNRPHDLDFCPSEDKLYIIDRDNNRIQVFDKNGTFLFKWGEEGDGDGEFALPTGSMLIKKATYG